MLSLTLTEDEAEGDYFEAEYDGAEVRKLDDVYSEIVTSADGSYAAWIEREGAEVGGERVARWWWSTRRPGTRSSARRTGWVPGRDNLDDLYAEDSPYARAFRGDELPWHNAEENSDLVTTDLATGGSTITEDWNPEDLGLTSGAIFASPDGRYTVDTQIQHRLRISPRQPDFGHRWQVPGGWLDDHTLLVLGHRRGRRGVPRDRRQVGGLVAGRAGTIIARSILSPPARQHTS